MEIKIDEHILLFDEDIANLLDITKIKIYWNGSTHYYVKYGNKYIHRLIMGIKDGKILVDHINGNSLDNRKSNLRLCSRQENTRNNKGHGKNKYKGVDRDKRRKSLYFACITVRGLKLYLGSFDNEKDAALAYNKAATKYFGEFAKLNVIED